jgi:hypothetical protein
MIARSNGSLGVDCCSALEHGPDEEGRREEPKGQQDPGLPEIPGITVHDHPDAEADD